MDIGDSISINSIGLCFFAVVVSFEVYFFAENVRGFMLLYEVVTSCLLGCNSTSLRKFQRNMLHSSSRVTRYRLRFACLVNTAVMHRHEHETVAM